MNLDLLLDELKQRLADAEIIVTRFESGSVDISLRRLERLVVVQCTPGAGFGVSLVSEGGSGFDGHDEVFHDATGVIDRLCELLSPSRS